MSQKSDDEMVAALLRERVGYARFGKKDRVAAVDAELKRLGYKKEPRKSAPQGRKAPQKATAVAKPGPVSAAVAAPKSKT